MSKEQRGDRMAVAGDEVAVGGAQCSDEQAVLHRARVDEQELLVGQAAIEGRQADHAGQAEPVALDVDADAVAVELVAEDFGDPRRGAGRLERQDPPAVMLQGESDVGAGHGQPLHDIETGGIFGAGAAQELAPGGDLGEQALDADAGAGGQRRRALACPGAMVDCDPPAVAAARPAFERQARHAGDRRQRLAAEAEARDPVDRAVGQLRGRVALERQGHVGGRHAAAVVDHLDEVDAAAGQPDRDRPRARVQSIFDQFLQGAGRPLDHLAGGDAINQFGGQQRY